MADVRTLLRAERSARAPPKTQLKQAPSQSAGKKRKAVEEDDETRKRTKAEGEHDLPSGFFDGSAESEDEEIQTTKVEEQSSLKDDLEAILQEDPSSANTNQKTEKAVVDEDEWEAFNREIHDLPQADSNPTTAIFNSSATIYAAPMTTAEIEAQRKKDEQKTQRVRREEELEGEREDATRTLEDEFEEMEELEKRVIRLKEMRERLREGSTDGVDRVIQEDSAKSLANGASAEVEDKDEAKDDDDAEDEDDDDDDDDDDWSKWGFGRP